MKLYTKRGDDGGTDLIGGRRVPKCDLRVTAYGEVDETNAAIGLAIAGCEHDATTEMLRRIQSDLFVLGAELATQNGQTPTQMISEAQVQQLERWIDDASGEMPSLKNFILPGGSETAARFHLSRAVCRRAERAVIGLSQTQPVGRPAIIYLNRLSDLLFALARCANRRACIDDVPWMSPGA